MKSVVVDFETYYGDDYTLSSMTTEEYVRDRRFETILCGFKVGREPGYWVDGPDVADELERLALHECAVIAHHAHFDGLILSHHYGVKPKLWIDTLSMARAVHGAKSGLSLGKLCKKHGLPDKGTEVDNVRGMRRRHFSPVGLRKYGTYCVGDCEREYELARIFSPHFGNSEIMLIDNMIRMFTEPVLELNEEVLSAYKERLRVRKVQLLVEAGVQLEDLRSSAKFAEILRFHGVEPEYKLNPKGEKIYAFAKKDPFMEELAEHEDEAIQALAAARLNARSTINESRVERLLSMASRGRACVYLTYYGAHSGRASGGDKLNWQNLERVAFHKDTEEQTHGFIRNAVEAPEGYVLVVGDSMNIESRMLDWLAGQEDQVEAYRLFDAGKGPDIYCVMAEKIYGRAISKKKNPNERFVGKTAKLGLGYGTGAEKFAVTTKLPMTQAARVVKVYRSTHPAVVRLWNRATEALQLIADGVVGAKVDYRGIITTTEDGLLLPNGLVIKYRDLKNEHGEWSYWDGRARQKIYGAKVVENIVQALARIVVMAQTLMVPRRLVLSVHDEGVWVTRQDKAERVKAEAEQALRTPLPWCQDLPLNCEVGYHKSYGKAKQ